MNCLLSVMLVLATIMKINLAPGDVRIEADPADSPLVISSEIGRAFMGNLRLTAYGGGIESFTFLPSDLKRVGGNETIGRQNVQLVGATRLIENVPQDFQVTVTGINVPGEYQGQAIFLLSNQSMADAMSVDLKVTARVSPVLNVLPGSDQIRLKLVNCNGLDCWLAKILLPGSAFLDRFELQFENPNQADVTIVDAAVAGRGDQADSPLTSTELGMPQLPYTLAAGKTGSVVVALSRDKIPPDHYAGTVYFTLQGRQERLTLPVDLSVRRGPALAILMVLIGLGVGQLVRLHERIQPQLELLNAVDKESYRIYTIHNDDRDILEPMINSIRDAVYLGDLDAAKKELEIVKTRFDQLRELRTYSNAFESASPGSEVTKILGMISDARNLVKARADAIAAEKIRQINEAISKLDSQNIRAAQQFSVAHFALVDNAVKKAKESVKSENGQKEWRGRIEARIRTAKCTHQCVPVLVKVLTFIGLMLIGLKALYVDQGLALGANPFLDYLALVSWGLSSDIASRTLRTLVETK